MKRWLAVSVACGGALFAAAPAAAQQLQTADEAQRSSLTHAITSPLRDVNLMRSKIPVVLQDSLDDPYRRPTPASCSGIIDEVTRLNEALGDDLDADEGKQIGMRGRAKEEALNAIAGLASDVIPFRGWVRKITGAERHDKTIQQSIAAGAVRRAYLKGLGEARGCNPPGTPMHKPLDAPILTENTAAPPVAVLTAKGASAAQKIEVSRPYAPRRR
ncbi:MAG: hypothetical protein WCY15_03160 [Phenylobacterium sp.]|jgi:hypothetical protein|uniref:hypothetical protein n=1 Tax=Phenylobacterium sp. TaxID=1871053 RepID=UPI002A299343|nr:hypothetical protein [Phenylobacterium sp.]MDD3837474.1 hypothetical protein [Phenylobacterium sp.]MDX9998133.1 hypothetical protein [Phenylobacterium sp.]